MSELTDLVAKLIVEVKHLQSGQKEIKEYLNKLPCDNLSSNIESLKIQFDMRVAEFQKEGAKRDKDMSEVFKRIRSLEAEPDLSKRVKTLEDVNKKSYEKWESRAAYVALAIIVAAIKVGYL